MPLVEAGAALAVGSDLWSFNKANYQFDKNQRQQMLHQVQNMRVNIASLHREDMRDLFGLTITKMDTYMVVTTLLMGYCITLYYDGYPPQTAAKWLFWLWAQSLVGALAFLSLSLTYATYTSLAAQGYSVRVLTRKVRLPVPAEEEIELARAYAAEYELDVKEAMRIPFLMGRAPRQRPVEPKPLPIGAEGRAAAAEDGLLQRFMRKAARAEDDHKRLFRLLQWRWRTYDSYTRVTMTMGTCHIMQAMMYFNVAFFLEGDKEELGAYFYLGGLLALEHVLIMLELRMRRWHKFITAVLLSAGPVAGTAAAVLGKKTDERKRLGEVLVVASFAGHMLWFAYFWWLTRVGSGSMPMRYRMAYAFSGYSGEGDDAGIEQDSDSSPNGQRSGERTRFEGTGHATLLAEEDRLTAWIGRFSKARKQGRLDDREAELTLALRAEFKHLMAVRKNLVMRKHPAKKDDGWILLSAASANQRWYRPSVSEELRLRPGGLGEDPPNIDKVRRLLDAYGAQIDELRPPWEQREARRRAAKRRKKEGLPPATAVASSSAAPAGRPPQRPLIAPSSAATAFGSLGEVSAAPASLGAAQVPVSAASSSANGGDVPPSMRRVGSERLGGAARLVEETGAAAWFKFDAAPKGGQARRTRGLRLPEETEEEDCSSGSPDADRSEEWSFDDDAEREGCWTSCSERLSQCLKPCSSLSTRRAARRSRGLRDLEVAHGEGASDDDGASWESASDAGSDSSASSADSLLDAELDDTPHRLPKRLFRQVAGTLLLLWVASTVVASLRCAGVVDLMRGRAEANATIGSASGDAERQRRRLAEAPQALVPRGTASAAGGRARSRGSTAAEGRVAFASDDGVDAVALQLARLCPAPSPHPLLPDLSEKQDEGDRASIAAALAPSEAPVPGLLGQARAWAVHLRQQLSERRRAHRAASSAGSGASADDLDADVAALAASAAAERRCRFSPATARTI